MGRTLSTAPRDPADPNSTDDLDGRIVDGLEALRQRLVTALRFRARTWFLARAQGLDYDLLLGHRINAAQAASTLNDAILEEGGEEVTGLADIEYAIDRESRRLRYSATVRTVYGDTTVATAFDA